MAKLQNPKEPEPSEIPQPAKSEKKSPFLEFELWKLERDQADKTKLNRSKMIRKVKILQEHADILNEQKENTLLEYVR